MSGNSEQGIIIREKNGKLKNFDAGDFANRIRDGFAVAGAPDAYLAEDIAFALEFALSHAADNAGIRIFERREVEEILCRILEASGLEAVKEGMSEDGGMPEESIGLDINGAMVIELFRMHFSLSADEARFIAAQVREAMQKTGITVAPPELLTAFAQFFINRRKKALAAETAAADRKYKRTKGKAVEFSLQEDALVPVRKLRISLPGVAADENWDLPLTELTSAVILHDFGRRLRDIAGMERHDLPLAVIVAETASGAAGVLGSSWPDGRKVLKDLLEHVWAGLGESPARIMFKSEG